MPMVVGRVLLLFSIVLLAFDSPATAHFQQGVQLRTVLLARDENGLVAFLRTPAPLLFTDVVRAARAAGTRLRTPFLYPEVIGNGTRYRLSLDAIAAAPGRFHHRLKSALAWQQNGRTLTTEVLSVRVVGRPPADRWMGATDARRSLEAAGARLDPVFGRAVVEAAFHLQAPVPAAPITVRSALPALHLPEGVGVDNHILDARWRQTISRTRSGQLTEGITLDGSRLGALAEFVRQGMRHIVGGADHVLLVICLALGVGLNRRLLWLVTAFTVGHTITLVGTFLGTAPAWPWFVPAIETAIAASILIAAIAAARGSGFRAVWILGGIGLLHGLGFSVVLGDILGRGSPDLVPLLAAFTVGIELGQMVVLSATLATLWPLQRMVAGAIGLLRKATLAAIALVAAVWVVERSLAVF